MAFKATEVQGFPELILIDPRVFEDKRGYFMEVYSRREFDKIGITDLFVQENQSRSGINILRGLHFQKPPHTQSKLVRCTRGEVFDVVVDLRKESPSYSRYFSVVLSETNRRMLYVPKGFAHGFLTLSPIVEVCYSVDEYYAPESEGGILWNDTTVSIQWPAKDPEVNDRDKRWPTIDILESPFVSRDLGKAK